MKTHRMIVLLAFLYATAAATAVNFLVKRSATGVPALELNGVRLVIAAVFMWIIMCLMRLRIRPTKQLLLRYLVVGALTMALPQALIFVALRNHGAREADVGFIEAGILGMVVIYLLAAGQRVARGAVFASAVALLGLVEFLDLRASHQLVTLGHGLVLIAAVLTGVGMILAERFDWSVEEGRDGWRGKLSSALRKTMFTSALSGLGTLAYVAIENAGSGSPLVHAPSSGAWPTIIALAIPGTCIGWFAFFVLIELKQLILAAAVIAAIPVSTVATTYVLGESLQWHEWVGGTVVIGSVATLLYLQLVRKPESLPNRVATCGVAAEPHCGG